MKKFSVFFDSYIRCSFSKRLHFFLIFFSIYFFAVLFLLEIKKYLSERQAFMLYL